jgi:hypothetical protein
MADTKKYWKEIVEPDDLDAHMLEVGQATINAQLIYKMFSEFPLKDGNTLYVPGCGTGQMFDFLKPSELGNVKFLFSDFKLEFLERLKQRISADLNARFIIDDVEESKVIEKVDAALIVLLLQHINWKRGLGNILATQPSKIFLIIQEQDATDGEINQTRVLRPSIKKFSEVAKSELVDRTELEKYLKGQGYSKKWMRVEAVPNTKRMVSLVFTR